MKTVKRNHNAFFKRAVVKVGEHAQGFYKFGFKTHEKKDVQEIFEDVFHVHLCLYR